MNFVTNRAVNMERKIPSANVCAKPLMEPVPFMPSTSAAIKVVMLPSRIAESAFLKPTSVASFTVLPAASSSRIRAKMITFASTAIPMERMIPAIPGKVNVISNASKRITSKIV